MMEFEMIGTRCLTYVYDESTPLVCMYRQFDGYPSVHGMELVQILESIDKWGVNDMGCISEQIISHFKASITEAHIELFHLLPPNTKECYDQDYEYHVYRNRVIVKNHNGHIMVDIDWNGFKEFCLSTEE